jgi:hypothetical protein
LPVVAITDGAKAIRYQLEIIFGHPAPVILDWYHLENKKRKGMRWSPQGSEALGILKVIQLNGQWEQFWVPEKAAA